MSMSLLYLTLFSNVLSFFSVNIRPSHDITFCSSSRSRPLIVYFSSFLPSSSVSPRYCSIHLQLLLVAVFNHSIANQVNTLSSFMHVENITRSDGCHKSGGYRSSLWRWFRRKFGFADVSEIPDKVPLY